MATFDRAAVLNDLLEVARVSISEADPDKRAPLIARAESIAKQLEELATTQKRTGDPLDEIAARRSARGGATSRLGEAARGPG